MELNGVTALVTGGAHRVGRAIALALAAEGAQIALHYHSSEAQARQTVVDIEALGVAATLVRGDLTRIAEAERVVDEAAAAWGRLDLLVCSAGIWGRMLLGQVSAEQWERLFALNVRGPFFMAQRAAAHLRAARGCIIAVVDAVVERSWPGYTPYLASKAALAMVVHNLAADLAPDVRVNGVSPGPVLLPDDWDQAQHERAARSTLLRQVGSAEDVAGAVLYLARADYVTGVIIPVDGGQRLK